MVTVEEDLITKIFSQTVQVSPSDDVPEAYQNLQNSSVGNDPEEGHSEVEGTDGEDTAEEVVVELEEQQQHDQLLQSEPIEYDKVPTDFSHFNQTIIDLDDDDGDNDLAVEAHDDCEDDVVVEIKAEEEDEDDSQVPAENTPDAIVDTSTTEEDEYEVQEPEEDVEEPVVVEEMNNSQINTPSTATPVDNNDEQSEIRDFEEIERITQLVESSPEQTQEVIVISDDDDEEEEPTGTAPEAADVPEIIKESSVVQADTINQRLQVEDVVDCILQEASTTISVRDLTRSNNHVDHHEEYDSDVCIN